MVHLQAVLFDLDGTLLDIDFDRLMYDYTSALGPVVADVLNVDAKTAIGLVMGGTERMMGVHPGYTNKAIFDEYILEKTGIDISGPEAEATLERFYTQVFPTFGEGHGPFPDSVGLVQYCLDAGMAVGIATQPLFPALATRARMRWAGIEKFGIEVVSSYEVSYSTKPHAEYFLHMAEWLGVSPDRCLMVGDEPVLDMAAENVGMSTFFAGKGTGAGTLGSGSLTDLRRLLTGL